MKRLVRWFLFVAQALFVCVLVAAGLGCYVAYLLLVPAGGEVKHTYELPPGSSAATVASDLEGQRLIRSAAAFRVLLRFTGAAPRLQAGKHALSSSMTALQVLEELQKATEVAGIRVTVPEGKTVRQVAAIVQLRLGIPAEDVLAVVSSPRDVFPARTWLPAEGLEGYLFPDTFNVAKTARAREVIDMMLVRFEKEVLPVVRATPAPHDLDLHQVMTMASLVEAEAQVASERPRIAAVYYNRLKADMPLQCDATILYALKQRKSTVTLADLQVDSPYNTYRRRGLPPGPICNPGLASVRAAMAPEKTGYLYYVRNDVRNDGSHVFARTYEEHQRNIRQFQR